jgi:hypothetical protein
MPRDLPTGPEHQVQTTNRAAEPSKCQTSRMAVSNPCKCAAGICLQECLA